MKLRDLKALSRKELLRHLENCQEALFRLRLRKTTEQLENPAELRSLRREIARVKTLLREDELGIRKAPVPIGEGGGEAQDGT